MDKKKLEEYRLSVANYQFYEEAMADLKKEYAQIEDELSNLEDKKRIECSALSMLKKDASCLEFGKVKNYNRQMEELVRQLDDLEEKAKNPSSLARVRKFVALFDYDYRKSDTLVFFRRFLVNFPVFTGVSIWSVQNFFYDASPAFHDFSSILLFSIGSSVGVAIAADVIFLVLFGYDFQAADLVDALADRLNKRKAKKLRKMISLKKEQMLLLRKKFNDGYGYNIDDIMRRDRLLLDINYHNENINSYIEREEWLILRKRKLEDEMALKQEEMDNRLLELIKSEVELGKEVFSDVPSVLDDENAFEAKDDSTDSLEEKGKKRVFRIRRGVINND